MDGPDDAPLLFIVPLAAYWLAHWVGKTMANALRRRNLAAARAALSEE